MVTKTHLVVGAIILFSLLQLLSLGQPATLVFDENHYVKTARMVSLGYPDYNIEHPPLGKRIIATSINFLGDSPWGWRVPSFLFSIATLILTFSLARNFLGEKTALLAGFLLALDPLWIVVSRLGMLDIFATFFAVLFVALTLRYLDKPSIKLAVFSGVALGVSLAVKWVGITLPLFFALIVGISYYRKGLKIKTLTTHLLSFSLTILGTYFLIYLFFQSEQEVISLTDRLFFPLFHHTGTKSPYSASPQFALNPVFWFTAPFLGSSPILNKENAKVILFFSPLSGWVFLAAISLLVKRLIEKLDPERFKPLFLIFAFFLLYLPWLVTQRPEYVFHIFPLLPLVYLIQAKFGVILLERRGWGRVFFAIYLAVSSLLTAALLPYLLGLPLTVSCYYNAALFLLVLTFVFAVFGLGIFAPRKVVEIVKKQF